MQVHFGICAFSSVLSSQLNHIQHQERQRQLETVRCWLPFLTLWDHMEEHHPKGASFGKENLSWVEYLGCGITELVSRPAVWPLYNYLTLWILLFYPESQIMTYFEYVIDLFCELRNEKVHVNYEIEHKLRWHIFRTWPMGNLGEVWLGKIKPVKEIHL